MGKNSIIIGTRGSELAVWQADYIASRLMEAHPGLAVEKKLISTKGDRVLDSPLAKIGGKGLFTKELESQMLDGSIDIAVHSLKDMPVEVPDGLVIAAVTRRRHPGDALVSRRYGSLAELPMGARVGTSSLRRRAQLLAARPDIEIVDIRGNVRTRLRRLEEDGLDAIVLAVAGLMRLGMEERIAEILPTSVLLPAVGQGALAVETRAGDAEVREMIAFLDDAGTRACALAERSFLRCVDGGCQVPVGVYATLEDGGCVSVEAVIASPDGKRIYRDSISGSREDATQMGEDLARRLLAAGGREILQELGLLGGMGR